MTGAAPLRVGIVAGESSGDQLGAALIGDNEVAHAEIMVAPETAK